MLDQLHAAEEGGRGHFSGPGESCDENASKYTWKCFCSFCLFLFDKQAVLFVRVEGDNTVRRCHMSACFGGRFRGCVVGKEAFWGAFRTTRPTKIQKRSKM